MTVLKTLPSTSTNPEHNSGVTIGRGGGSGEQGPPGPEGPEGPPGPAGGDFDPLTITYYVDAGYAGADPSDGTIARPFLAIQEAIDAGAQTVLIVGGSYDETVTPAVNVNLIALNENFNGSPVGITGLDFTNDALVIFVRGCNVATITVTGALTNVTLKAENCLFSEIDADSGGVLHTDFINTTVEGGCNTGTGTANLLRSVLQTSLDCGTLTARDCTLADVFAARATFYDCTWPLESTLQQSGVSGGGGGHANPPWRFVGCVWDAAPSLASQGGGESMEVYFDDQSWGNFWSAGGATTSLTPLQDSGVSAFSVVATDGSNTIDTSTNALYKAIATDVFTGDGATPWLLGANALVTFQAAYAGAPPTPQSAPGQALARIIASVSSAAGGLVGCAVSINGDVIGEGLTNRIARNSLVHAAAGITTQIVTERVVELPLAANTTIQPVFASDSGDDLTLVTYVMTLEPIPSLRGF